MLLVKSKTTPNINYLFESEPSPLTAEEFAQGKHVGKTGKLEGTLNLSKKGPPIHQSKYDEWRRVIRDCAHPELKCADDEGYDSLMVFLSLMGVNGDNYRIHIVRG